MSGHLCYLETTHVVKNHSDDFHIVGHLEIITLQPRFDVVCLFVFTFIALYVLIDIFILNYSLMHMNTCIASKLHISVSVVTAVQV